MSSVQRLTTSFNIGDEHKSIWTPTVITSTILLLVSGTGNTILFTLQGDTYNFKHGVLQTALMFVGEYLNLFIFNLKLVNFFLTQMLSRKYRFQHFAAIKHAANEGSLRLDISMLWLGVPSLLDSIGSSLQIVALLLIPASV